MSSRRTSGVRPYGRTYVRGRGQYTVYRKKAPVRRAAAYRRPQVRGRGAYKIFDAPALGSALGGVAGGAIGSAFAPGIGTTAGAAAGAALGRAAGQAFRSITGFGDYTIHGNSLLYPDQEIPSFGDDSITIRKREMICDLASSTTFYNTTVPLNPGLSDSFPWLSGIANSYSMYRWNGIIAEYVSTSSDAVSGTSDLGLGQVILATSYDAAEPAFVNAPQALGSLFSNSGRPSVNIMHAIECDPREQAQKAYYIRSGDNPAGTDIRMYDMGTLQCMVNACPAEFTGMGQLWISYSVTLFKSVNNGALGLDLQTDKYQCTSVSVTTGYFGAARTQVEGSNLGCTVTGVACAFPVTLSSGYYLVSYGVSGGSAAVVAPTWTFTNATVMTTWQADSNTSLSNSGTTSTVFLQQRVIRIDDREASFYLSGGTLPTSASADLIITQINGDLFV